ncbi:MAG: PAS domain S-box protein, partial [Firmicutes bacterium]|nr:PAS domain S-box protein [Bacillota bacterium]
MSLRTKAALLVCAFFLFLSGLTYLAEKLILLRSFSELESRNAFSCAERALRALRNELSAMETTATDWAEWDETYAFVEDLNDEYKSTNLIESTFLNLKLNFMVFINSAGQIAYGKGYDLQNKRETPVPESLKKHLLAGDFLSGHGNQAGVVVLPENPLLIVTHPILTGKKEGPARGALVIGRYLDAKETGRLAENTGLPVNIYRYDDAHMPPGFAQARRNMSESAGIYIHPLNNRSMAVYSLVKDIYEEPALLIGMTMPREIYGLGRKSTFFFFISFMVTGLVLGSAAFLYIERAFIARLESLGSTINGIRAAGGFSMRVPVSRGDELERLATSINAMLCALEKAHQELQESEERYRSLVENSPDLICTVNNKGEITAVNQMGLDLFGYSQNEVLGRHFFDFIHHEDVSAISEFLFGAVASKREFLNGVIFRMKKASGEVIWIEANVRMFFNEEGLVMVLGVARDITARKEAEELVNAIYSSSPVGIFVIQKGKIISVNSQFLKLTGYSEDELLGTIPQA